MTQDGRLFRLIVRLTIRPSAEAEFDELARRKATQVLRLEPGVVQYICFKVDGQPPLRVFTRSTRTVQPSTITRCRSTPGTSWLPENRWWRPPRCTPVSPMAGGFRGPRT
jgi:hypothetical protein